MVILRSAVTLVRTCGLIVICCARAPEIAIKTKNLNKRRAFISVTSNFLSELIAAAWRGANTVSGTGAPLA